MNMTMNPLSGGAPPLTGEEPLIKKRGRKCKCAEEVEFWLGAMKDAELAEYAHLNLSVIFRRRTMLGINPFRTDENEDRDGMICADLLRLQNAAEVASYYGMSRERVRQIARDNGMNMMWIKKDAGSPVASERMLEGPEAGLGNVQASSTGATLSCGESALSTTTGGTDESQ
jgi:hypothetical protein